MALSDTAIRAAKPGPKPIKLADERGLFLLVQPSGGKLWRLKYRFEGKEKKLSLGRYPDVSLKDARLRRDAAREKVASGIDPGIEKRQAKVQAEVDASSRFEAIANEYLAKAEREGREAVTIKKSRWLLSLLTPSLGQKHVGEISPQELLEALRVIEGKGHLETARRMRSLAGRIFRYAVATGRAQIDPSSVLRGALTAPRVRHHSAILNPEAAGRLLLSIEHYVGQPLVHLALKLTPHVFVRPGELRRAEWTEVDLEVGVWTIPAEKMKMRQPHKVPLSRQARTIFEAAHALSKDQKYIFSALYPGDRPMSENTINAALRRLGYGKDEMSAHGFRAMASTLLNESGQWNPDAIERALAHDIGNSVRGSYHRGSHWEERVRMAQWWSDYLDQLKENCSSDIAANRRKTTHET
ncbi:MAG: integrase arm-type DNA-binding domain-containing protein [Betaproteobacteria bacterium]|nr:integrase arm-type DNA-binding domain-containing protein [Betaproteobacteria bacterium]